MKHYGLHRTSRKILVGLADMLASIRVAFSGRGRAPEFDLKQIRKILILRPDHLGDVLLTTPVVAALRAALPEAHIAMAVKQWSKAAVETNPKLDKVVIFNAPWCCNPGQTPFTAAEMKNFFAEQRAEKYDLIFASQVDYRTNRAAYMIGAPHRVGYAYRGGGPFLTKIIDTPAEPIHTIELNLRLADAFGIDTQGFVPEFYLNDEAKTFAKEWFSKNGIEESVPVVSIHPGAGGEFKRLEPYKLAETADRLSGELGAHVLLLCGPGEEKLIKDIEAGIKVKYSVFTGEHSLQHTAGMVARSRLFIGYDSGPAHIAAALGVPSVVIFGPSDPRMWGPVEGRGIAVHADVKCGPCPMPQRCGDRKCLKFISVDDIMQKAKLLLDKNSVNKG